MSAGFRLYRKKPVIVRAKKLTQHMDILTLEGVMHGNPGDYLIEGVHGELYPCKSDIFEATYEPVEDGNDNHLETEARVNQQKPTRRN